MKKIAFVVQRFGTDLIGGAEKHAYSIAEKLSQEKNIEVSIFTTTSKDYQKWDHHYETGESHIGNIKVHRYKPLFSKPKLIFSIYSKLLFFVSKRHLFPSLALRCLETLWVYLQGPFVPDLVKDLKNREEEFDSVFLFTYLYYPSLFSGIKLNNFIFIPTAHDEPPFYFQRVSQSLKNATKIFANTHSEAELISKVHHIAKERIEVVGLGLELPDFSTLAPTKDLPKKFMLYLGRINKGKGVDTLIEYFHRLNNKDLYLILAGKKDEDFVLEKYPNIIFLGAVEEDLKWSLLSSCLGVICPSEYESLSLLTLEAMICSKPVLLNGNSKLFQEYSKTYPTAFAYKNFTEFFEIQQRLLASSWKNDHIDALNASRNLVFFKYSWENIIPKFMNSVAVKPN